MSLLDDELRRLGLGPAFEQPQVALTPEEEESLTSQLVSRTMGGLESAAWALDTPGAFLRGLLGGSPGSRLSGRELLTNWGLTQPNDPNRWEWQDGLGLAADIVFDPLTYLTFGAGALSKGGQLVKAAGLSDDAVRLASKTLGRNVGQRVARLSTSVDDLVKSLPADKLQLLEQAAQAKGVNLADIGGQKLGSLVGFDVPFSSISGSLGGTGARSLAAAEGLDNAAAWIGQTAPARYLSQWFDPTVKDTSYGPLQTALRDVKRDSAAARPMIEQTLLDDLRKVGVDGNNIDSFRTVLETRDLPDVDAANDFLANRGLAPILPETFDVIRDANRRVDLQFNELPEMGIDVTPFESGVGTGYFPSQALRPAVETPQKQFFTPDGKTLPLSSENLEMRKEGFDFYGGRPEVSKFTRDRDLNLGRLKGAGDSERTLYVLENSPAAREVIQRQILDETPPGEIPREWFGVVTEAKQKRDYRTWEPLTESDRLIYAKALLEDVDPLSLKQRLADEVARLDPQMDPARVAYIQYMKGKMSPNWWKKYIYDKNGVIDATLIPGFDVWAEELLDNMGVLQGIQSDRHTTDVALEYLRKWGSPTNAVLEDQMQAYVQKTSVMEEVLEMHRRDLEQTKLWSQETLLDQVAMTVYDKAQALQKELRTVDPVHASLQVGLFDKQPLQDARDYAKGLQTIKDSATAIQRMFASVATDTPAVGYTHISEVLDSIPGFAKGTLDEAGNRLPSKAEDFYRKVSAEMGIAGKEYIPTAARDAAMSLVERMTKPAGVSSLGKVLDSINQVTKFGLTLAPAFYTRNWGSGQIMNALSGSYKKLRDFTAATSAGRKLSRGRELTSNLRIPGYEGKTAAEATQALRDELIVHQVVDTSVGEQVQNAAQWAAGTSSTGQYWRTKSGESGFNIGQAPSGLDTFSRGGQRLYLPASLGESTDGTLETLFGGVTPMDRLMATQPILRGQTLRSIFADTGSDLAGAVQAQRSGTYGSVRERLGDFGERVFGMGGIGGREKSTGAIPKMHEALNQLVEVENRTSAYVGLRLQGYSPATAAARVRSMHIDYGDVSSAERAFIKRVVPFYGFQKGISKFLLKELSERPGGGIGQTIQMTAAGNSNDSYVPEYINEGLAIPNPFKKDSFLVGLGLMHESAFAPFAVGASPGESIVRSLQKSAGMLNPLIKAPIEQATGINLFTGRRLEDLYQYPLVNASTVDERLINSAVGASPLSRLLSSARVAADDRKSPLEKVIRLGTGLKLADLSGGAAKAREFEARREVEDLLRSNPRVKSFENIYVPKDVRSQLTESEAKLVKLYELYKKRARKAAEEKKAAKQ